jgi:hypothetical protein
MYGAQQHGTVLRHSDILLSMAKRLLTKLPIFSASLEKICIWAASLIIWRNISVGILGDIKVNKGRHFRSRDQSLIAVVELAGRLDSV